MRRLRSLPLILKVGASAVAVAVVFTSAIGIGTIASVTSERILAPPRGAEPQQAGDQKGLDETAASSESMFIHRATTENIVLNSTYIDHPLANGNPDAFLSVTPNWNPGGTAGIYNNHPVGVWYNPERQRWAIFNQDLAPMPAGAAFNVRGRERVVEEDRDSTGRQGEGDRTSPGASSLEKTDEPQQGVSP